MKDNKDPCCPYGLKTLYPCRLATSSMQTWHLDVQERHQPYRYLFHADMTSWRTRETSAIQISLPCRHLDVQERHQPYRYLFHADILTYKRDISHTDISSMQTWHLDVQERHQPYRYLFHADILTYKRDISHTDISSMQTSWRTREISAIQISLPCRHLDVQERYQPYRYLFHADILTYKRDISHIDISSTSKRCLIHTDKIH